MSIAERVILVIVEQLGVEKDDMQPDSRLAIDLGARSIDIAEIIIRLETIFEITIDLETDRMETVGDAIALCERKLF